MRFLFLLILGAILLLPQRAYAAEQPQANPQKQTLAISPAILEETLDPGSVSKHEVLVINSGTTPQSIRAYVRAFTPNEYVPPDYLNIFDSARWFKIDNPDFILLPGERKKVTYTVSVPKEAGPGGHYATIYFEQLIPVTASDQDKVFAAPRVGMLAFLTVTGDIKEDLKLTRFSTPWIIQQGPIEFTIKLKNDGNVHVLPSGKVRIYNIVGYQVGEATMQPGMVLPHTEREFKVKWFKAPKHGMYNAQAEITYGTPGKKIDSQLINFRIIPWIGIVIAVVLTGVGIKLNVRTKGRWREAWQELRKP